MDFPERSPVGEVSSNVSFDELQRSFQSLRRMFHVLLVILLVLTGSFSLYLLREVIFVRRQVRELSQFVTNYDKNSKPVMQDFLTKLQAFAKINPDFAPILAKYYNPTNPIGSIASTNLLQAGEGPSSLRMPPTVPTK
jgi:hypothetical protein